MTVNTKTIEMEILKNIDGLMKIISQMSQAEDADFLESLPEAEDLIMKTNPLLKQLLNREALPYEQIYRQFIAQKLPHPELQKCFSNLEPALEAIFALPVFHQHLQNQPPTKTSEAISPRSVEKKKAAQKSNLDQFIIAIYPHEKILKNYYFRSIKLDYFLPQRKLAVLLTPRYYRRPISLTLLTLQEGLQIIEISPRDLNNPHLLYHKFPRLSSSF